MGTSAHAEIAPAQKGWVLEEAARFPSFSLRLVTALVLIALLPLGAATWVVGEIAARSEVEKADATLNATLRGALAEFDDIVTAANTRARVLARSPRVQRALASRDRAALARLARGNPNIAFTVGADAPAAGHRLAALSSVAVVRRGRTLGRVVVAVPLNESLLSRLGRAGALPAGDSLAIASDGRLVAGEFAGPLELSPDRPASIRLEDSGYRAVAGQLLSGPSEAKLVTLRPTASIDKAVAGVRWDLLLAALATLATIVLIGCAAAPAIGRGRISRQQRAQAVQVLSHVGDGVFLADHDGTIRFWNNAAERITGLPASDVIGRRPADVLDGWADAEDGVPLAEAPGDAPVRGRPAPLPVATAGRDLWLAATGVRFSEGIVYAFRDVTEEQRLDELKSDFLTTVTHEVRTPLTSIYGASMMLKQSDQTLDSETRERLFTVLSEQTDRLSNLFDDVMLASRLDADDLDVARVGFDAFDVARAAVRDVHQRSDASGAIELSAPDALPRAVGDPTKVRMVLTKLIENATKYSSDGGRIEVELGARNGSVCFEVSDHGPGISAGEQRWLFQKFYRADPTMSRGVGGSGLGLYICHELVRRMGGDMWAQSRPGKGSTFAFELPAAQQATAETDREGEDDASA